MALLKKTKNDAVKAAVTSYLERRNYPDIEIINSTLSQSAKEMAVSGLINCELSRSNSILYSCVNNDPTQYDVQYDRLLNFIKDITKEKVKNELLTLLSPLLCHLYFEMLRGGHSSAAQMLLKKYSPTLPQKDLSYNQIDGNLPSALYRPNSLEQLFNSLQNGTIDNDTPEKDFMSQILDEIGSIYTLQEVETKPVVAAFRSCKYEIFLSQESLDILMSYISKHSHVLLIQVLQTWFHFEVDSEKRNSISDKDDVDDEETQVLNKELTESLDEKDIFLKCNGHAEFETDKELKDLQDAIKGVRESMTPLKFYKISAPDAHLVCAQTDLSCNLLCGGFSNSEVRIWDLGKNKIKRKLNPNISEIELACNIQSDPDVFVDNTLHINVGQPLRGHSGPVQAVGVLPQEQLVLSASHDCTMRAWRTSDFSCVSIYRGHNYPIWCMDISKSGLFIVTGSHDRTAKLWFLERLYPVRIFVGHVSDVTCVKFHPNEAYVASGSCDRSVRLWSVCDARLVRVLCAHRAAPRALAFSPEGHFLASTGDDKKIKIWDLTACTCIYECRGHHSKVTALDWSSLGKPSLINRVAQYPNETSLESSLLCSAGMDGVVKVMLDSPIKNKQSSSQEVQYTYNTKCSYLVDIQVHSDWIVAIGTKR